MRGALIAVGGLLLLAGLTFLVIGQVWVAQGKTGTWGIWYMYVVHGAANLAALTCFFVAAAKRKSTAGGTSAEVRSS